MAETPRRKARSPKPKRQKVAVEPLPRELDRDLEQDPVTPLEEEVQAIVEKTKVIRYTRAEAVEQMAFVQDLYLANAFPEQILELARRKWPKFTRGRYQQLVGRLRSGYKGERLDVDSLRDEAIRRLKKASIDLLKRAPNGNVTVQSIRAYIELEKLRMKLEGTEHLPKIEVHQNYQQALIQVIGGSSSEELDAMLEEQRLTQRAADVARKVIPALVESTDD